MQLVLQVGVFAGSSLVFGAGVGVGNAEIWV